ncbi:glyoxalase [bacterium]|nr:glyoxalase [bacterium]|tara:strand:- start:576 stop:998 length:423 start_codon:yes stop_codon:yes gene_type:complete
MSRLRPFHLAFPVRDLKEAKRFYVDFLGCGLGRSSDKWIDFDFFGHQVVAHLVKDKKNKTQTSAVDSKNVPVEHFGIILSMPDWKKLALKLESKGVNFIIKPYIRFKNLPGEQATMFFLDPSGNALEFKAFKDDSEIFKT